MISKKQLYLFFSVYFLVKIFSSYFQPGNVINTFIAVLILFSAIYFLLRRSEVGWYIIAAEFILGGTENFLKIGGVSIRTLLLVSAAIIFIAQKLKDKKLREIIATNKIFCVFVSILYIWLAVVSLIGLNAGHIPQDILSDIIPYLFLFYYFPLFELLRSEKFRQLGWNLLIATIFGNLVFMLYTFIGYSSGLYILQDSYYHWFRDIANGKITGYDFNFYRIVLNEQLLLIPLLLFFIWRLIKRTNKLDLILAICLSIILSINFTRSYLLALAVGLLFLFPRTNWKRWLAYGAGALTVFFLSFTLIHFSASRGQSLGWEFFGIRLQSITAPQTENSSLTRLIILPAILDKIKTHPILGNGLGDRVMVGINYLLIEGSPIIPAVNINTTQFDWGYLEIVDELGAIGALIWLTAIVSLIFVIIKSGSDQKKGMLASLIALLVINVTSPALFHVMGVVWMVVLFNSTSKYFNKLPISSLSKTIFP